MEHDDTCQCFACIDARIDEHHDGAIEKLERAAEIEEQRRKERVDRIRARRESHEKGMNREYDPSAPSINDLRSMFDFDT